MTEQTARDALMWRLTTKSETPLTTDWAQRQVAQLAAEVRAAALTEAADAIDTETRLTKLAGVLEPDRFRPCRDASAQLRRMAAATRPDDTTPAVGDRYDSRHGGDPVTVTRLWTLQNGNPAVNFEWCNAETNEDPSALPLDSFRRAYKPARPDDTTGGA